MIKSLKSIKFYLAITIVFSHMGFISYTPLGKEIFEKYFNNGNYAVAFFFILSGFSISLGYSEKFKDIEFSQYLNFIKRRINKIYPLYIITMGIFFVLKVAIFDSVTGVINIIFDFLLCVPMLQTLTIKKWGIFNSPAWYISCIFILYLCTPIMIKLLNKIKNTISNLIIVCLISYILLAMVIMICKHYMIQENWEIFLYTTPYIRIFNYFIGIVLGFIYIKVKNNCSMSMLKFSIAEVTISIICILAYFYGISKAPLNPYIILVYIPVFCIWTFIFAFNNGIISGYLSKGFSIFLGDISMELYLIHYLTIIEGSKRLIKVFGSSEMKIIIYAIFLITVSFVLAILSHKFIKFKIFKTNLTNRTRSM